MGCCCPLVVKPSSCAFSQHSSYSIIVQTPLPSLSLLDYLITEEASTHRLPQRMQKSHGFLFFVCIMCITGVCSCEYRTIEAMMHSWRSEDNLRCWSLPSTLRRGLLFTVYTSPAGHRLPGVPPSPGTTGVHCMSSFMWAQGI